MILIGEVVYYKGVPYYVDATEAGQRLRHIPSGFPLLPTEGLNLAARGMSDEGWPDLSRLERTPFHVPDYVREKIDNQWFGKK